MKTSKATATTTSTAERKFNRPEAHITWAQANAIGALYYYDSGLTVEQASALIDTLRKGFKEGIWPNSKQEEPVKEAKKPAAKKSSKKQEKPKAQLVASEPAKGDRQEATSEPRYEFTKDGVITNGKEMKAKYALDKSLTKVALIFDNPKHFLKGEGIEREKEAGKPAKFLVLKGSGNWEGALNALEKRYKEAMKDDPKGWKKAKEILKQVRA